MASLLRFVQVVFRSSRHNLFLVLQIIRQHLQEVHDFRLIVYQCKHDHTKGILHLGMFVQLV